MIYTEMERIAQYAKRWGGKHKKENEITKNMHRVSCVEVLLQGRMNVSRGTLEFSRTQMEYHRLKFSSL